MLEKMRECGFNTFYKCVDLEAAYDSTDETGLLKAMKECHVSRDLRYLVELTLKTERRKVTSFNRTSPSSEVCLNILGN
jgi:mRNA-degrading endonuclease YafQ of YafQ-DinJ toxin-antitoxin module